MPKKIAVLVIAAFFLLAGGANAVVAVHEGESIQKAIDAAVPGETIEVYSGTYEESIDVNKPLTLKGVDSGSGMPFVDVDDGPAIVLSADGIILEGFSARSSSGWGTDAGVLVISKNNVIRNNAASGNGNAGMVFLESHNNTIIGNTVEGNHNEGISLRNSSYNLLEGNTANDNRYGIKLQNSKENTIRGNIVAGNSFDGIYLEASAKNIVEYNYAEDNWGGVSLDNSRDNIIRRNDILHNEKGISLAYRNSSGDVKSEGKGVYISYNSQSSESRGYANNTIFQNNLSNRENAYDDGLNRWDNGRVGNNYSDFNDPSEGCEGRKVCDKEYRISGGSSVDRFPLVASAASASPVASGGSFGSGPGDAELLPAKYSFMPGGEMRVKFTAPADIEAWASLAKGNETWDDQHLGRNTSGSIVFTAPDEEGSYILRMHDKNGTEILSFPFNVTVPRITASPSPANTCEKIYVSYSGAPGLEKDWIGMYRPGGTDAISWQYLKGRQSGTLAFSTTEAGHYEFRMFESGGSEPLVTSSVVEVETRMGVKVIAEPSRVSPGGTITVTFWGAPASGSGVLGMYGIMRPDKFHIEKRRIGSKSCGSMTFRAPSQPGQYDFRMFADDINRPILGYSNVVTVA
ncbi:MAG: NosD domain-containing protein [Methanotrichaceae archaeon]|nr:NosD domain-containing protein [Methanotrichaceae archaeon]